MSKGQKTLEAAHRADAAAAAGEASRLGARATPVPSSTLVELGELRENYWAAPFGEGAENSEAVDDLRRKLVAEAAHLLEAQRALESDSSIRADLLPGQLAINASKTSAVFDEIENRMGLIEDRAKNLRGLMHSAEKTGLAAAPDHERLAAVAVLQALRADHKRLDAETLLPLVQAAEAQEDRATLFALARPPVGLASLPDAVRNKAAEAYGRLYKPNEAREMARYGEAASELREALDGMRLDVARMAKGHGSTSSAMSGSDRLRAAYERDHRRAKFAR